MVIWIMGGEDGCSFTFAVEDGVDDLALVELEVVQPPDLVLALHLKDQVRLDALGIVHVHAQGLHTLQGPEEVGKDWEGGQLESTGVEVASSASPYLRTPCTAFRRILQDTDEPSGCPQM